jgi:hypothetical protein
MADRRFFFGAANDLWLLRKFSELRKIAGYGRTKPAPTVAVCLQNAPEKRASPTKPRSFLVARRVDAGPAADHRALEGMTAFNPFPGQIPSNRTRSSSSACEKEIDELLLRSTRFLSVVGTSGSGSRRWFARADSSLHSGFMARRDRAGESRYSAQAKPTDIPGPLDQSGVLGSRDAGAADASREFLETTLRRGSLGIADAGDTRIRTSTTLWCIDQPGALPLRRSRQIDNSRDEAIPSSVCFPGGKQSALPIYVVLDAI